MKFTHVEELAMQAVVDWDGAGKVHDWRNHVPDEVRTLWGTFNPGQRLILFRWADDLAGRERRD